MNANGRIIQLEVDLTAPVVAGDQASADFLALDLWIEQLASIPDAGEALRIHWLIAVCPYLPDSLGQSRPEV